jgi:hypothetical protein
LRNIRKIQGAQVVTTTVAPPRPNNLQEECIRVQKVYDWIVATNRDRNKVAIPDTCRAAVDAALAAGNALRIECIEPDVPPTFPLIPKPQPTPAPGSGFRCDVISIRRPVTVNVNGRLVEAAVVRVLFTVTLTIVVIDETTGVELCRFPVIVRFDDEFVLCVPEPLGRENILCRITAIDCTPTMNVLLGDMIELEVTICKEIQVEAEVKLEVLAKFCQPRPIIPIPPERNFQCPPFNFPPQCPDLFPVANCDCQATANVLAMSTPVTFGPAPTATDVGTQQLIADICPNCDPGASTFSYTFFDTTPLPTTTPAPPVTTATPEPEIPGDESFTIRPVTISSPTCDFLPGGNTVVITGTAIRTFTATGTQDTVFYTLTITEFAGTPIAGDGTFSLVLTDAVGTTIFNSGVVTVTGTNGQVNVRDCVTFPDVLNPPSIP